MDTSDRTKIEELLYRSFWLIDHGQAAACADLFNTDGRLTFGPGAPKPGTIGGSDIASAMTARQAQTGVTSRHILSNVIIEQIDQNKATMQSLLTLFKTDTDDFRSHVKSVADIMDVVVRQGSEWKIEHRTITPVFNL